MLSPPLPGAIVPGARQYVRRGIVKLRPPHCSRRSRTKFFAEAFFQKGWKAGAGKIHASRAASVTDFAGGSGARLNGCLAACGPRFL
ncbi:hypothetical protein FMM72_01810 [Anaerotruncus colihominis]|uniref:Uncharacterized protein n=1 Tax=Anaerotruncus colihominis TaxID=169435 RepID=A0A845SM87_9FIRM|nr:hypothetical protein [Anaerotruncus colihominis]